MKKRILSILTAACLLNAGCTSMEAGATMMILGIPALIGGIAGAAVGSTRSTGRPTTAPLVYSHENISLEDVKKMAQSGIRDETIIHTLISTHTHFSKSQIQPAELKMAGVSQKIIDFLYETSN